MSLNISSYSKIFALGHRNVINIFRDKVEITEKVDGSQFVFGKDMNGVLHVRSKGQIIDQENPPKMFQLAVDYVQSIAHMIEDDRAYYCEYLNKPKHNTLTYGRVPKNYLALYGHSDFCKTWMLRDHCDLEIAAHGVGIEAVPLIYSGMIKDAGDVTGFLERKSFLGGERTIEGIVVKNFEHGMDFAGQWQPVTVAKYVSEQFKEVHQRTWKADHTTRGGWELFVQDYRTDARWDKAIQHLEEQGLLAHEPKDIGALMKEINKDITDEEKEVITAFLWKTFSKDLYRVATRGFPAYYKQKLLEGSTFNGD